MQDKKYAVLTLDEYRPPDFGTSFPHFPFVVDANSGLPWSLYLSYIQGRVLGMALDSDVYHVSSYHHATMYQEAHALCAFANYLSDSESDALLFPSVRYGRPTYRYRAHLIDEVNAGRLSRNTANKRMNTVVNFYRVLASVNVISEEIRALSHTDRTRFIKTVGSEGFTKTLRVKTTDLAIRSTPPSKDPTTIEDEGARRPLSKEQQILLMKVLCEFRRTWQLMFLFSLTTGARLQTVCTLRIRTLKGAKKVRGVFVLKVGAGTGTDTKNGKIHYLMVSEELMRQILVYIDSPDAKAMREKSFYGDTDDNYVFLTTHGSPYYTSVQEKADRRKTGLSKAVSLDSASSVKPKLGESISSKIATSILPALRKIDPDYPEFTFHDLRATFGLNLLRFELSRSSTYTQALSVVQQRMGHRSVLTTEGYLNYHHTFYLPGKGESGVPQEIESLISEGEVPRE